MIPAALFSIVSPAGVKARLSILIFHRILAQPDPLFPGEADARWFGEMLGWVKRWFNVLSLDEAISHLNDSTLPARAAVISFDDGYADNYQIALPLLHKHQLSATFFIATGFLDGGRMWNDTIIESIRRTRRSTLDLGKLSVFENSHTASLPLETLAEKRGAIEYILGQTKYLSGIERALVMQSIAQQCGADLPDDLMMTSDQVIQMRGAGMLIGAHTVNHPILANLPVAEVRKEISDSKHCLESLLQEEINLFAYPNGKPNIDYLAKDASVVRELGFKAGLSTAWGVVDGESDLMQLPRFTPWDRTRLHFGARLIKNILQNSSLKPDQSAA